jgi:hypothetical protein
MVAALGGLVAITLLRTSFLGEKTDTLKSNLRGLSRFLEGKGPGIIDYCELFDQNFTMYPTKL